MQVIYCKAWRNPFRTLVTSTTSEGLPLSVKDELRENFSLQRKARLALKVHATKNNC